MQSRAFASAGRDGLDPEEAESCPCAPWGVLQQVELRSQHDGFTTDPWEYIQVSGFTLD